MLKQVYLQIPSKIKGKISLADPTFTIPGGIDILLGVETWTEIMLDHSLRVGKVRFQDTLFGHVVHGTVDPKLNAVDFGGKKNFIAAITQRDQSNSLRDALKRVFEYEPQEAEEKEFAQTLFDREVKQLPDQRWEALLILTHEKELGDSYGICAKRNARVLANLNESQTNQVIELLREQRDAGIIKVVNDERTGVYFNPIVLVWKKPRTEI